MFDSKTINEFCTRLRESLPITEMPITEYQKGYNAAMMLVSMNSERITQEMLLEIEGETE